MNLKDLRDPVVACIDAGISVELISSPGIGKSEFVADLVDHLSARDGKPWGFSTAFLATYTPPDLIGYQFKGERVYGGKTVTVTDPSMPLWMITREGNPVHDYDRGLLFLDEYGQGESDVKRASAELLLNHRIGPWALGRGWGVIAASNRSTDRSGVTKGFDFVINRRMQFEITPDVNAWTEWAISKEVMPLTIAFANQNPNIVFEGKVPDQQGPWCTPRSLVMADKFLQRNAQQNGGAVPFQSPIITEALQGIVGAGAAAQLVAFCRLESELPKFEDIIAAPGKVKVPNKPDAQMLSCHSLAHRVDEKTIAPVIEYVERMPKEFAVTFAHVACKRKPMLVNTGAVQKWAKDNASLMAAIAR